MISVCRGLPRCRCGCLSVLFLGCAVCAVLLVAARVQEWGLSLLQMGPLLPFERRLLTGPLVHLFMFVVITSPGASTIRRQMPAMSDI